ncbi:glycosyltransferase family 2 protein [Methyloterricola oryzae]|uniref:glycosyltransferase family 2 protein n=1 Tax=Methyloterricola oryzae TaxID=1495050 RepID=UPI00069A9DFA|nr:glycosyltransferase family 2 protein [Methyloterricola oryzae]
MPRISIIIPTYNRAAYLDEAIQSVLAQTCEDWELIVVDDGSTDATADVVAKYTGRITYKRQANAGACAARNLGLACASGEYVSFLDSDDRMLPNNLADLLAVLEQQPSVDVAYGWYYWMEADGSPSYRAGPHIRGVTRPSPWPGANVRPSGTTMEGQVLPKLLQEETMLLGTALVRRSCVEAVGGFDTSVDFNEHWDFFLSLAREGYRFACCREVVTLLRLHKGNRGQIFDKMLAGRIDILDRYFNVPSLKADLARVRGSAYYLAYMEYARVYFASDNIVAGTKCLNKAIEYNALRNFELKLLPSLICERALHSSSPVDYIKQVIESLAPGADSYLLRRQLLGKLHACIAKKILTTSGLLPKALWHCVRALWHDPTKHRAKELARLLLNGLRRQLGRRAKSPHAIAPSHMHL